MNLRKKLRKESALERHAEYNKLSTSQKIILLDMRLGVGVGATRQRANLARVKALQEAIKPDTKAEKADAKPYSKPKKS